MKKGTHPAVKLDECLEVSMPICSTRPSNGSLYKGRIITRSEGCQGFICEGGLGGLEAAR